MCEQPKFQRLSVTYGICSFWFLFILTFNFKYYFNIFNKNKTFNSESVSTPMSSKKVSNKIKVDPKLYFLCL